MIMLEKLCKNNSLLSLSVIFLSPALDSASFLATSWAVGGNLYNKQSALNSVVVVMINTLVCMIHLMYILLEKFVYSNSTDKISILLVKL